MKQTRKMHGPMKGFLALMLGLVLSPLSAQATTNPDWTVDPHGFEYDMSLYVSVQRNNIAVENVGDLTLAAFVGAECRGLATLHYVNNSPYFYLRVRSHVPSGETVTFKCYDKLRGVVDSVMAMVAFENLKQVGFPSVPLVMPLFIPVTAVSLDKGQKTLLVNQWDTLTATITPLDATDKKLVWSSNNEAVAKVIGGYVQALKAGTATIFVQTLNGNLVAKCQYTVLQPVLGVQINKEMQNLLVGNSDSLTATVLPADASNKDVLWSTDNDAVAVVSNGVVTAMKTGTARISVKTVDGGFSAQCLYTVLQPVTGIQLDKTDLRLLLNHSETLTATLFPADASNTSVTWSSSDPSVASVANGVVTALRSGSAIITVQTDDGGWKATCSVYVPYYYTVAVHATQNGIVAVGSTAFNDGDSLRVLEDSIVTFILTPDKSSEIGSVLYGGSDVTALLKLVDGHYLFTTAPIRQNTNLTVQFRLRKIELIIQDAESGTLGIAVEPGKRQTLYLHTSPDWELYSVTMNNVEVLGEIVQNTYTTPELWTPSTFKVLLRKIVTIRSARAESPIRILTADGLLTIRGAATGEVVQLFNLDGKMERSSQISGTETTLKVRPNSVYILKIGAETFKIAI